MYKALVTDLDNTLFKIDETEPPSAFFPLIRQYRSKNFRWLVATGRSPEQVFEFSQSWPEKPDWVIARERYIYEINSGEEMSVRSWNNRLRKLTENVEKNREKWEGHLDAWLEEVEIDYKYEDGYYHFNSETEARRAEKQLDLELPEEVRTIRNRVFLGLVPREVGKGRCLSHLVDEQEWRAEGIICVGDSANDLDMLDGSFGFASAAVSNAEEVVKKAVRANGGILLDKPGGRGVIELIRKILST